MRAKSKLLPLPRRTPRVRHVDAKHFTILVMGFIAILAAVTVAAIYMHASYTATSADKTARTAQEQLDLLAKAHRESEARRVGSIVVTAGGTCEELRFDNFTGAHISIAAVNCNDRLTRSVAASNALQEKSASMREVFAGFGK